MHLRPVSALLCVALAFFLQVTGKCLGQSQSKPAEQTLRLSATLIQVPTIVTDRSGRIVEGLSRDDFTVLEDGKRQQLSIFAAVDQPFHAVLVLDASNSTEDRLRAIRNSAAAFVREASRSGLLMIISFDNEVHQLTDFASDRSELEQAVEGVVSGYGKLLYEAMDRALDQLKDVEGRRAVVLFSDGLDLGSIEASSESTIRRAEEIGAVIYVVRFETRWWIEASARRQKSEHNQPDLPFSIDGRIPLPPDFGGPDPTSGPGQPRRPRIEINPRPTPPVITRDGRREVPASPPDEITEAMDKLYGKAEKYMQGLASLTGGLVFAADSFGQMESAFRSVADELRKQYLLGYYTAGEPKEGRYCKLKVEVRSKDVKVRARPGYRWPARP